MDGIDEEVRRQARETVEAWQARDIPPEVVLDALGAHAKIASWAEVEVRLLRQIKEFNGVRP